MDSKNKVTLKIGPLQLNLITGDSVEYAESLGAQLDRDLTALLASNSNLTLAQAMAMLALQSLDEANKANDTADNIRSRLKTYLEDTNKYRLAAEAAKRENELLKQELSLYKK